MSNHQPAHVTVEHRSEWKASELISVKPDLFVPSSVLGKVETSEYPGTSFALQLDWNSDQSRYSLTELSISKAAGLTTHEMHAFSLPKLISYLSAGVVLVQTDAGFVRFEEIRAHVEYQRVVSRISSGRLTAEALSFAARIYSCTRVEGGNPNGRVASELHIPQRTATRWIARAKAEGFID
jgi:hypothetical protein